MGSYLVTGGCGFIGSHLADALVAHGHRVRILDDLSTGRRDYAPAAAEIVVGDVADGDTVRRAMQGVAGCFHLAAVASVPKSVEAWLPTHRVNLNGTINVLEAAHAVGNVPVVYASSAAVYGDNPGIPLTETIAPAPHSPYGADKASSEMQAHAAFTVRGIPSTGLRFFNVFGPRQDPASPYAGVISIFAERMQAGQPVTIFGDGGQTRDFVFVADAVSALLAAMDRQDATARVFNVGRGESISLLSLVAALERVVGRKATIRHALPRTGDVRHLVGDVRRIREGLGFTAKVGLEEGMARLLGWLEAEDGARALSA